MKPQQKENIFWKYYKLSSLVVIFFYIKLITIGSSLNFEAFCTSLVLILMTTCVTKNRQEILFKKYGFKRVYQLIKYKRHISEEKAKKSKIGWTLGLCLMFFLWRPFIWAFYTAVTIHYD